MPNPACVPSGAFDLPEHLTSKHLTSRSIWPSGAPDAGASEPEPKGLLQVNRSKAWPCDAGWTWR